MEEQSNKTRNPLVIQQFISNCIAVRIKIVTMDCVEIRVFDDQYNAASITGIGVNSLLRMLKLLHTTLSSGKEQGFTFINEEKTMVVAIGWHSEMDAYSLLIDKFASHIFTQDIQETVSLLNNLIQKIENIDWVG